MHTINHHFFRFSNNLILHSLKFLIRYGAEFDSLRDSKNRIKLCFSFIVILLLLLLAARVLGQLKVRGELCLSLQVKFLH